MNYDDFQVLTESEYFLINSHYANSTKIHHKEIINQISKTLSECICCCRSKNLKLNHKVQNLINQIEHQLNSMFNNLIITFNLTTTMDFKNIQCNIFSICEQIANLIDLHQNWISTEEKEYYRNIAINNNYNLIAFLKNIFSILKESFIISFKHM